MKNHNKITWRERDKIAVWLAEKITLREIARRLERSVSSISDEIKRNTKDGVYTAISAQYLSVTRASSGRSKDSRKASWIYNHIENKLREGWTPEQIAGRLKREYHKKIVCHETIYRYVYCPENADKNLKEYLVRHHGRRSRKRYNWLPYRGIQGKVSIHDRPDSINTKRVFGHWETDAVEGRNHIGGIQTMLERKTRYYRGKLVNNIDSINGFKAQSDMLSKYPKKARLSVTMDNGKENYDHRKLNEMGIATYFCDPYCSWQKGSNENHNGILRRYIPKKTDLRTLTQGELNWILDDINNKPRKCLNYETAKEAFTRELNSIKFKCSDSR
jgi:IS30 family transposase